MSTQNTHTANKVNSAARDSVKQASDQHDRVKAEAHAPKPEHDIPKQHFTHVDMDAEKAAVKAKGFFGRHKRKFKIAGYTIAGAAVVGGAAYICYRTGAYKALVRGAAESTAVAAETVAETV